MGIEMPHFTKQATGPKIRLPNDGSGAALILALLALASSAGVAVLTDDLLLALMAFAPISLALLVLYAGVRRIFGWPRIPWKQLWDLFPSPPFWP
ncbi:hypothetical protein MicloDRAFT_00010710 [Microvirga lotononidis]|uniref:Uncharacterized protein n=2 Tax=Microvirga lotononidis TaxID=864069 RepID=I4Z224_9HYPH|nr:hypothetical protein MicloDRAFT_00010710 [Microvirga lotononidis]